MYVRPFFIRRQSCKLFYFLFLGFKLFRYTYLINHQKQIHIWFRDSHKVLFHFGILMLTALSCWPTPWIFRFFLNVNEKEILLFFYCFIYVVYHDWASIWVAVLREFKVQSPQNYYNGWKTFVFNMWFTILVDFGNYISLRGRIEIPPRFPIQSYPML